MMAYDHSTGWTRFDYSAQDGLRLAARCYGWEHRQRAIVICLAGLTRNSADFHDLALRLANDGALPRAVFAPDYRGRGMSARDPYPDNYNPLTEAEDILTGMAAAGIAQASIIGTSRGGLIAMILSALRPRSVKAIVLNDIGPKIGARGLLRIRNYLSANRGFANWSGATQFLKAAGEAQFTAFGDGDWARQAQLIYEERDGAIQPRYDPALLRALGNVRLDQTLPEMWPQFRGLASVPVLAIRGAGSELLEAPTLNEMARTHPDLESVTIDGQGHAPDLGSAGLPDRIAEFLRKADRRN